MRTLKDKAVKVTERSQKRANRNIKIYNYFSFKKRFRQFKIKMRFEISKAMHRGQNEASAFLCSQYYSSREKLEELALVFCKKLGFDAEICWHREHPRDDWYDVVTVRW